jgi:C4-dicarboxylate-specific signal transduction histidine kinase
MTRDWTARRAIRDANRAGEVVSRLRALFAKQTTSTGTMNLNEAVREVISLSHRELQKDRVNLQSELSENLPPIQGDRVQLQQVILNLIQNGADAMRGVDDRARELVLATTEIKPDCVLVSVRDTGPGIHPANLERVFDAFYTTKTNGIGIGLAVCRTIVEAHGGRPHPMVLFSSSPSQYSDRIVRRRFAKPLLRNCGYDLAVHDGPARDGDRKIRPPARICP